MANIKASKGVAAANKVKLTDTNLLLLITVVVFVVMYAGAMIFLKKGFLIDHLFFELLVIA